MLTHTCCMCVLLHINIFCSFVSAFKLGQAKHFVTQFQPVQVWCCNVNQRANDFIELNCISTLIGPSKKKIETSSVKQ